MRWPVSRASVCASCRSRPSACGGRSGRAAGSARRSHERASAPQLVDVGRAQHARRPLPLATASAPSFTLKVSATSSSADQYLAGFIRPRLTRRRRRAHAPVSPAPRVTPTPGGPCERNSRSTRRSGEPGARCRRAEGGVRLQLDWSEVGAVVAGAATRLVGRTLEIDLSALQALLESDPRLERVRLDLAQPGESCRIARVFDVFSPRSRDDGAADFPGVLGPLARTGSGRTRALANVAIVVTDQQLDNATTLSVIDMSGPAALLTPFARTQNVVISAWPDSSAGRSEYLAAIRLAGLRAAVHLARAARGTAADAVEVFDLPAPTRVPSELGHLPRVAYVFQIHSHQRPTGIDEGILYGDPVRRMLPTVVHPNEILDGAVVRGFMGRNATTYAIQNHPVIQELYARHARDLWFTGVVLTVAHATEPERVRSAAMAAGLVADVLGADGAVFTKMGGGAPHVDMAQAAAQCEARGVKTTLIVEDMSTDGSAEGMLLFNFPGLDALVNVGCGQEKLWLPAMARVIGAESSVGAAPSSYVGICGAIEQVGTSRVMALVD